MKTRGLIALLSFCVSASLVAATPGTGRWGGIPIPGAASVAPILPGSTNPNDFGAPGESISTFNALAFQPANSGIAFTSFAGAMWPLTIVAPTSPQGITGPLFVANLQVPEGAVIDYFSVNICNENVGATPLVFGIGEGVGPDFTSFTSPVANGCGTTMSTLIGQQITSNTNVSLYLFVNWENGLTDGSIRFNAAQVWWHRDVSPAPATATFGDVPTSDPGFRFIEALVASGITAGCGGGNYCPDANLTRRQMAVFLAKALGLYWPNILE